MTGKIKDLNAKIEDTPEVGIGFKQSMICSWISGGLASTLTNPLDLAKLRLQVQRAGGNKG